MLVLLVLRAPMFPPLDGPQPKPPNTVACFSVDGSVFPLHHDLLAHRGLSPIYGSRWLSDKICQVNTCPSFHISLLAVNKIHPASSTNGCSTGDFISQPPLQVGGVVTWLSSHTEQDRLGWVQLTSTCLLEITGPGPPHTPLSVRWSSTTHSRMVP